MPSHGLNVEAIGPPAWAAARKRGAKMVRLAGIVCTATVTVVVLGAGGIAWFIKHSWLAAFGVLVIAGMAGRFSRDIFNLLAEKLISYGLYSYLIKGFLRLPSWEAKGEAIDENGDLLSPECFEWLERMIREERVDGMRQSLVDHREFLRSHAKQAYAILHGGGDTGGDQDLIQQADDTPESDTGLSPEAWEILLELRAPTAVIGAERRLALCRRALALLDRRSYPGLWAGMNAELGRLLPDSTEGNRADNLDRAINCYGLAFEILTKESEPDVWAEAQFNLGNNYMDRINGDRADNVECAIRCYERAIEVRTRYAHPVKWAETSINLGNGYRNRIGGERRDNLQQAVSCYQRALEVLSPEAQPMEWIGTNANLVIVNDLLAAQGKASGIVRRT